MKRKCQACTVFIADYFYILGTNLELLNCAATLSVWRSLTTDSNVFFRSLQCNFNRVIVILKSLLLYCCVFWVFFAHLQWQRLQLPVFFQNNLTITQWFVGLHKHKLELLVFHFIQYQLACVFCVRLRILWIYLRKTFSSFCYLMTPALLCFAVLYTHQWGGYKMTCCSRPALKKLKIITSTHISCIEKSQFTYL